jgi:D-alanyl-D-alanine carboxypeptidase
MGFPMGRPALTLRYPSPKSQPVQVFMRSPPSAGLLFNLKTGQVLWQLRPTERRPIASLTKMMTAWLVVHAKPANAHVLITRQAVEMPGSKVGVLPLGRRALVETLMYGLLLPSGNDAAVALAQGVAGSVRHFVTDMNREAAHLGLGCTRYSSPSGYYNLGNYSCAADLAVLAHDDLLQPRIAEIVRELTAAPPLPIAGGRVWLYNNNPLLIYHYPGVTGMKTGYTIPAGKCLVATAERRGVRLGVVLLHSPFPGTQARRLLNAGFAFSHVPPVPEPPMPPGV